MIKVKFRIFSREDDIEVGIVEGENIRQMFSRITGGADLPDPEKYVSVFQNGLLVEDWDQVILMSNDHVIVAPKIGGGDSNNFLRTAMVIAITVAASIATSGMVGWQAAAITATASTVGAVWASSIFPPQGQSLTSDKNVEDSQMYTIAGQSNQVKRMGFVPRVYGNHRMFPNVAANPYTELEVGSDGKLVHFLYAVYDFGLGPTEISDIRIGDTPITAYSDIEYRLVDFNRPAVPTKPWDVVLENELKYYKGDVTTEQVAVVLDINENDVPRPPSGNYQAVRSAAPNLGARNQEITFTMVAPQGLFSVGSNGAKGKVTANFRVEIAEEGTENWVPFNDLNHVKDFRTVGGDVATGNLGLAIDPNIALYQLRNIWQYVDYLHTGVRRNASGRADVVLPAGSTTLRVTTAIQLTPNNVIRANGEVIGEIASVNTAGGFTTITFVSPTARDVKVGQASRTGYTQGGPVIWTAWTIPNRQKSAITRGVPVTSKIAMSTNTTDDRDPVYAAFTFWPIRPVSYKVRITRTDTSKDYTTEVVDGVQLVEIRTRFDNEPIVTDKRHTFLEVKIRATNQLNGTISNLSAICKSVVPVYRNGAWDSDISSNPAWIFADLLTGQVNKRAVPLSRLHLPTLLEWAEYCDAFPPYETIPWIMPRAQVNFVLDFSTTLQDMIEKITSVGQASMNIVDGRYGVLIDRLKEVPVQVFTNRNSSNFSSSRNFVKAPHAIEVQFVDPAMNWEMNSVRVYAEGYDVFSATEIEEIPSFGVTNIEQAWRYGRYIMAQAKYRQETMTIDVDYEHLVLTRGDFVQIAQDSMAVGGSPARVKSVVGNVVTIDDAMIGSFVEWAYVTRGNNGVVEGEATPIDGRTFELNGTLPALGDLIVFGGKTRVIFNCIVKAIAPRDDFAATLTLVEKNDLINLSESGAELPDYDPQLAPVRGGGKPPNPVTQLIIADNLWECAAAGYIYKITVDWEAPVGSTFEQYEVFVDRGDGFTSIGTTRLSIMEYVVDPLYLNIPHKFKVAAVSSDGLKLELFDMPEAEATPVLKTTPPSDVTGISLNITGEVLEIRWDKIIDCDVKEYFIRYSPDIGGAWAASTQVARIDRQTNSTSVQARTGTYLIKAIDFNDNQSLNAVAAITTVPNLFGKNLIQTVTDTPDFQGNKVRVVKDGPFIRLAKEVEGNAATVEYYEEGFYYYKEIVDLGDIYTVRVNSLIRASGFSDSDLMISWVPLASAVPLASTTVADWDVVTEYRVSDRRNVIADWEKLSDIAQMSTGIVQNFSEWRPFTVGDITGRVIQFRLRLRRFRKNVTPRVYDGKIEVDVPDREKRFPIMEAPVGGITMFYNPAFKGPAEGPNIQITMENSQEGDHWSIYDVDLEKFSIRFFDVNGDPVARRFYATAVGYGYKATAII